MQLLRLLAVLVVTVTFGCAPATAERSGGEQAAAGQSGGQPAAAAAPTAEVAAVVNSDTITESELAAAIQSQLQGRTAPPEMLQEIRQAVLQLLIDRHLVDQFVAAKKIQADPKKVDSVVDDIKKQVADAGLSFDEVLKREGHTEDSLRKRIAADLAFQKFADTGVTDAAVEQYYQEHKEELDGTEVQASHVLVKVEEGAADAEKQAGLTKAKAIRDEVTKGLAFAEAAKKYSACPSASEGGDLGYFPRHGKMVEPFAAAAFALKTGEVSQPVETPFGWHLIQVTDRKAGNKSLEEAREEVKVVLQRELWEKTAGQQRKQAKIEIKPEPASP